MSKEQYLKDSAETHLKHNDQMGHDAIIMSIDDVAKAKKTYPDQIKAIDNALRYAQQELRSSGYR